MTSGNRPGATHTFYSMRSFHMVTGIVATVIGVGHIGGGSVALAHPHIHFFQSVVVLAAASADSGWAR